MENQVYSVSVRSVPTKSSTNCENFRTNSHISNGEGMIGGSAKGKLSSGRAEDYNNNTIICNSNRTTMNSQNTMRLAQATPTNGMRMPHSLNGRSVMRPINGLSGRMNQPRQSVHFAPLPPREFMPPRPYTAPQRKNESRGNFKNPGAQGGFGLVAADELRRRPTSEEEMKEILKNVRRTVFGVEEDYEEQPLIAPEVVMPESTELEMPTDRIYVFRRSWTRDEAGNVLSEEVFKAYEYHLEDPRNSVHIVH